MFVVDLDTSQILTLLLKLHILRRSPHLISDLGVQLANPMDTVPSFPPVLPHAYLFHWVSSVWLFPPRVSMFAYHNTNRDTTFPQRRLKR